VGPKEVIKNAPTSGTRTKAATEKETKAGKYVAKMSGDANWTERRAEAGETAGKE